MLRKIKKHVRIADIIQLIIIMSLWWWSSKTWDKNYVIRYISLHKILKHQFHPIFIVGILPWLGWACRWCRRQLQNSEVSSNITRHNTLMQCCMPSGVIVQETILLKIKTLYIFLDRIKKPNYISRKINISCIRLVIMTIIQFTSTHLPYWTVLFN